MKRFYENPYEQNISAHVIGCTACANEQWAVTLDETYFYPEGGGQPGDAGTLGNANVLDTREKDGNVIHITDNALEIGSIVEGKIDWETRYSRMQHHTGEHIVSGIINSLYHFDNVGFHMGRDAVTLDLSGELTSEMLDTVELRANQMVWANVPVVTEYPTSEALASLEYRSKKELFGAVRIVTVPDCDRCACCGLHVAHTGEVGMIKFVTAQRYKGGTRIWMLCGERALADAVQKNNDIYAISALLSAKPLDVSQAVARLLEERDNQKAEIASLQEKLFTALARQVAAGASTVQWTESLTAIELRRYVLALSERCCVSVVLSAKESGWDYAIASSSIDIRTLGNSLNKSFSGRGGGKAGLVQGSIVGKQADLEDFFAEQLSNMEQ